jgi:hypothetical protein
MRTIRTAIVVVAMLCAATLILSTSSSPSLAQDSKKLAKRIFIQAQAMGQSTQLGRMFTVNIIIEELSTPDDQKALIQAFNERKNEGLVNAVSKMKAKGRISIPGTLGYDVNYIRQFPQPDGSTKIRLVTDRPITFGEVWSSNRSMDYSLSAAEIILSKDKKHNSGVLLPACELKLDKDNHLQIELLQNEWKLVNIKLR